MPKALTPLISIFGRKFVRVNKYNTIEHFS